MSYNLLLRKLSWIIACFIFLHPVIAEESFEFPMISEVLRKVLFPQGDGGSQYFRIPAIITAKNGDLLAVIDARRNTTRDLQHTRNIDIAFKRSTDNGDNWSEIDFITKFPDGQVGSDASLVLIVKQAGFFAFTTTSIMTRSSISPDLPGQQLTIATFYRQATTTERPGRNRKTFETRFCRSNNQAGFRLYHLWTRDSNSFGTDRPHGSSCWESRLLIWEFRSGQDLGSLEKSVTILTCQRIQIHRTE